MTEQELIARLREGATWDDDIAAADRIEELVKDQKQGGEDYCALMEKHDALHVKLTKAVEALVQLERIVGDILGAHLQDSESRDKAIDLIKTTLAELEGK